jgi:hypothetical protein
MCLSLSYNIHLYFHDRAIPEQFLTRNLLVSIAYPKEKIILASFLSFEFEYGEQTRADTPKGARLSESTSWCEGRQRKRDGGGRLVLRPAAVVAAGTSSLNTVRTVYSRNQDEYRTRRSFP